MQVEHVLKTDPDVFELTSAGIKNFEIRNNDRDYRVGHSLELHETLYSGSEMATLGSPLTFTGRIYRSEIIALVHGEKYGLLPGYVLLITKPL